MANLGKVKSALTQIANCSHSIRGTPRQSGRPHAGGSQSPHQGVGGVLTISLPYTPGTEQPLAGGAHSPGRHKCWRRHEVLTGAEG